MPSRHRHRKGRKSRRRRRGGQGVKSMLHAALLPATLYYLQKQQARRTRRRNRGVLGNAIDDTLSAGGGILDHATNLVKNTVKPLAKKLKGGTRRHRRHRRRHRTRRRGAVVAAIAVNSHTNIPYIV